jgi:23S rRNA (adenine2030-N6)-methyltransferase
MNYRHAFHAGNFADVVKHAILARILTHLARKEQAFRVIDTHAGAGLYDLAGEEATRTGEWRDGIARLRALVPGADLRELLAPYLEAVASCDPDSHGRIYPGSPLIALALMRRQDRLLACELEPGSAAALAENLRRDRRAKAIVIDGWTALNAYVPPKERRGLVVVDPAFEARDEFQRLAGGVIAAWRKWASGVFLLWYPIKDRSGPDALAAALTSADIGGVLRAEVEVGAPVADGRLSAAGVIVINPPWRLADELHQMVPALAAVLADRPGGTARVDWVTSQR